MVSTVSSLPLNKTLNLYKMTIIARSDFEEDGKRLSTSFF